MIAVGGSFGAYTYVQKGGVFCNAQTANFVLMAVQSGAGNWRKALMTLLQFWLICSQTLFRDSCLAYKPPQDSPLTRRSWRRKGEVESQCSAIPDDAPPQICQVAVNFIRF